MKKWTITCFVILLLTPILSACWNQKELTDLAFVMVMGVDKGKTNKYDLSFQIVIPSNVSTGQGGGQGVPVAVYSSSGNTVTDAARNATKKVSRRLYYAHTNLVVISEEIAKTELLNLLDALDRDPEFRTTTEIVIAKGSKAKEFVKVLTLLDKLPANKVTKEIKATESMLGENMSVNIDDFISAVVSKGKEPIANGYKVSGKKSESMKTDNLQQTTPAAFLEADGLAIFKDGKLKGWIDDQKARGVVWVLDKVKSTDINVAWNGKKDAINMAPIRSKTKVSVTFQNGKPVIRVAIENEGWISEANTNIDITDPRIISKIEKIVEKETEWQILQSVKAAQKQKSDIFGFGELVHRKDPRLWRKLKDNWNDQFSELEVKVKVDSYIRREGIRTNPFWSNMD